MKKIILVPVIHAEGSTSDTIDALINTTPEFQDVNSERKRLWSLIHERVFQLDLDPTKTKLFMDGNTEEIKPEDPRLILFSSLQREELKKHITQTMGYGEGEINLAIGILAQGIPLLKTEEPENVKEAGRLVVELALELNEVAQSEDEYVEEERVLRVGDMLRQLDNLAIQRDQDIIRNVNEQLNDGETGILVLGASHRVWDKFGKEIEVEFLDPELKRLVAETETANKTSFERFQAFMEAPEGGLENKG
ncbi:MAG: hypothetical protein A2868_00815 [Candidatus Levybacteria bacterium RIFCSPHIGHO2_01_FULL_40_15b]|nr:MAG: hypothetical protein A2868_00815 [Candidatus Levybacteria bacterium RIFCSPHIGHO2_01_FULL_40_15b]